MPGLQERPHAPIGSLEAQSPAPEPPAPAAPDLAADGQHAPRAAGSAHAPSLLSHWTEPGHAAAPAPGAAAGNPLAGRGLYLAPGSAAQRQADAWRSSRPDDAAQLQKIASTPQATWLGEWSPDVTADVRGQVTAARAQGTTPVFVAYNIPHRDLGQHSAGGADAATQYRAWLDKLARGVKEGGGPAVVILEPDALAQADGLPPALREERYALLREAVAKLKQSGATVYLDAGNPEWKQPAEMGQRLNQAGVQGADGFALNVSNFFTTEANLAYGEALSAQVGGKHFVVDTSRNGLGPAADRQPINPAGRALGQRPTTQTGHPLADAFLWVKHPGESDGTANGGPRAGTFWPEYALGLARSEGARPAGGPGPAGGAATAGGSGSVAGGGTASGSGSLLGRLRLAPLPPQGTPGPSRP